MAPTVIQNREELMARPRSETLRALREDALAILGAGLAAASPERALTAHLEREGNRLEVDDLTLDLGEHEAIRLLAFGKASVPMARTVLRLLDVQEGLVVAHTDETLDHPGVTVVRGGHPLPDQGSLEAGSRALTLADRCGPRDLLVVLISGGGSALLEATDLPLEALRATNRLLLRSGMDIHETNTVRKHLSDVKGGQLARRAARQGGAVLTLAISDVVGDDPSSIASGPTVPDPSTYGDAEAVLQRYRLWDELPPEARSRLEAGVAGQREETPKAGDPAFQRASFRVVANVSGACRAAAREAEDRGYRSLILTTRLRGESRVVAQVLAGVALSLDEENLPVERPGAVVFGGETTVTVRGKGRGGRVQELVLAAAEALADRRLVLVACDTDGRDGETDAAGAVADGETLTRAKALGLDPRTHLEENDSYGFFRPLGDLVVTGPTGTNVTGLGLLLAGPPATDAGEDP